ncbi:centrosomal protein of 290 kDa-like isoform X2 [Littorina saxatilis]|uniref:Uncharacterized protein n=1 Tax=Littorina saxatilis TaxID=31220 RepID=A0AAN9GN50_9CAEN
MSIPIHCCSKLSAENAALRKKVRQLKHAKQDLEEKLSVLVQKNKVDALLRAYCTTRDSSVQTEVRPWGARGAYGTILAPTKPEPRSSEADLDKSNKMINMHAQLLRRYEKEVKQNVNHAETISELTVKLSTIEKQLNEEREKRVELERQLWALKGSKQSGKQKASAWTSGEDPVLREVVEERNTLNKENKRLRTELKGLDKGFFDEVEDLKYALQQSAKLNKEYEKTLRKLCQQFGLPYPNPEKILEAT